LIVDPVSGMVILYFSAFLSSGGSGTLAGGRRIVALLTASEEADTLDYGLLLTEVWLQDLGKVGVERGLDLVEQSASLLGERDSDVTAVLFIGQPVARPIFFVRLGAGRRRR
jgi:hypothetical protein